MHVPSTFVHVVLYQCFSTGVGMICIPHLSILHIRHIMTLHPFEVEVNEACDVFAPNESYSTLFESGTQYSRNDPEHEMYVEFENKRYGTIMRPKQTLCGQFKCTLGLRSQEEFKYGHDYTSTVGQIIPIREFLADIEDNDDRLTIKSHAIDLLNLCTNQSLEKIEQRPCSFCGILCCDQCLVIIKNTDVGFYIPHKGYINTGACRICIIIATYDERYTSQFDYAIHTAMIKEGKFFHEIIILTKLYLI